jgi:LysR family nitrogen assimilation transcriptional regulator
VFRQIRALEHELVVPLFERTRQGMRPTAAGVSMAGRARRVLTELDPARAELTPAPDTVTGIVGLLESTAGLRLVQQVTATANQGRWPSARIHDEQATT